MVDAGDFDGALEMLEAMKAQAEFQAMQSGDMAERLTPDQLEIDEVELGNQRARHMQEKKLKEESVQSIRDLIKQELKSL